MTINDVKGTIYKVLNDLGIMLDNKEEDFDLRDNIQDSVQFISFIVSLEQEFEIEIPDDMLLPESIASFNNFSQKMLDCINR